MAKSKKTETKKSVSSRKSARTAKKPREKADAKSNPGETDAAVTVDRRKEDRRTGEDRRKQDIPVAVDRRKLQRREKVNRRRQIDPTTCERDYTDDEIEFMNALDEYKRASGRMFPTCSEVLEVVRKLGYEKRTAAEQQVNPSEPTPETDENAPEQSPSEESSAEPELQTATA